MSHVMHGAFGHDEGRLLGRSGSIGCFGGPVETLMAQVMHDAFGHDGRSILSPYGGMAGGADPLDRLMGSCRLGGGALGGCMGTSCSTSCCSSYSSTGRDGSSVTFSSTSHGVYAPGQAPVVETQRTYRDSSGAEKIGVSRTIGHHGRALLAERNADGSEKRTHQLLNVEDGTEFDAAWRRHPAAASIGRSRTAAAPLSSGPRLTSASPRTAERHGPLANGQSASDFDRGRGQAVHQTARDRAAAHAGRMAYEQQRDRMIDEARRQRHPPDGSRSSRTGQTTTW